MSSRITATEACNQIHCWLKWNSIGCSLSELQLLQDWMSSVAIRDESIGEALAESIDKPIACMVTLAQTALSDIPSVNDKQLFEWGSAVLELSRMEAGNNEIPAHLFQPGRLVDAVFSTALHNTLIQQRVCSHLSRISAHAVENGQVWCADMPVPPCRGRSLSPSDYIHHTDEEKLSSAAMILYQELQSWDDFFLDELAAQQPPSNNLRSFAAARDALITATKRFRAGWPVERTRLNQLIGSICLLLGEIPHVNSVSHLQQLIHTFHEILDACVIVRFKETIHPAGKNSVTPNFRVPASIASQPVPPLRTNDGSEHVDDVFISGSSPWIPEKSTKDTQGAVWGRRLGRQKTPVMGRQLIAHRIEELAGWLETKCNSDVRVGETKRKLHTLARRVAGIASEDPLDEIGREILVLVVAMDKSGQRSSLLEKVTTELHKLLVKNFSYVPIDEQLVGLPYEQVRDLVSIQASKESKEFPPNHVVSIESRGYQLRTANGSLHIIRQAAVTVAR